MTPPPPCAALLTAGDLAVGDEAIVAAVTAPPVEAERLAALGLVPGAQIRILRRGFTVALALGEARLALGRSWARALAVVRA